MVADVLSAHFFPAVGFFNYRRPMQSQSSRPIKTFTIGFHEKEYNEAEHASAVARHLRTEHGTLSDSREAMAVILAPCLYATSLFRLVQIPTFSFHN